MGNFTLCPMGAQGNAETLSFVLLVVPVMTKSTLSATIGVKVCPFIVIAVAKVSISVVTVCLLNRMFI